MLLFFGDFVVHQPRASQRVVPELPSGVEAAEKRPDGHPAQHDHRRLTARQGKRCNRRQRRQKPQPAQDVAQQGARLADVLTGVPMAADYPSLNLGQSVMVYCYQLASLMQQTAPAAAAADHHQLQALRTRTLALLSRLGVEDDAKLADWLSQRLGLLQQRDTAMLHRLLHDIEKNLPE